jgi:hypothetical protein
MPGLVRHGSAWFFYKKGAERGKTFDPKNKRKAKMNVATEPNESIVIQNVGPISRLEIPIPEGGGVVVLRGECGQGKSHAIKSVAALRDNGARNELRPTDGWPSGTIEGLGVTVRLGRRNTARGELICESLDSGVDPSVLVDPGLKDPIKADSKRLATLVQLAAIQVPTERWVQQCDRFADSIAVEDLVSDNPVETADRIRRRLHEFALSQEKIGESQVGEAATLAKSVADVDVKADCDPVAQAAIIDAANQQLAEAKAKQAAFASAAQAYSAAKAKLADTKAGLKSVVECEGHLALAIVTHERALSEFSSVSRQLESLERQVEAMRGIVQSAQSDADRKAQAIKDAEQNLQTARAQHADIAELEKLVRAQLPDHVPDEVIADLFAKRSQALEAAKQGEVVRRAKETLAKAEALAAKGNATLAEAEAIRTIARSTDQVLEQALVDAGYDTIRVLDGRLCVISERGHEPVSELSTGERWELALDIAARSLPSGGLLSVHQEGWQALDPSLRSRVAGMAKARGLVIITAEVGAGALRAEVV